MNFAYNVFVSSNCDTCKNKSICMFKEEFKTIDKRVKELKKDIKNPLSPIKIETTCSKYDKEHAKQNGFYIK